MGRQTGNRTPVLARGVEVFGRKLGREDNTGAARAEGLSDEDGRGSSQGEEGRRGRGTRSPQDRGGSRGRGSSRGRERRKRGALTGVPPQGAAGGLLAQVREEEVPGGLEVLEGAELDNGAGHGS